MKKWKWIFNMAVVAIALTLQSCSKDDGYSIGDFSWDWATVRTTGSGGYYLEGDRWGIIEPVASSIPWFKPVDGERVVSFFNPLADTDSPKGVQVKMEGIHQVLTKEVEKMTEENETEFGNDPIMIYQGDMWLGGKFLNIIFCQDLPRQEKHRISLVENKMTADQPEGEEEETSSPIDEDGYIHLELRYNTYNDVTGNLGWGKVSYNLEPFYSAATSADGTELKGFKISINSQKNGEGVVVVLDLSHPVGVPEKAQEVHTASGIR